MCPCVHSLQINHAVFEQKVDYDTQLFADAAMDIFHLRNTDDSLETKPAWLGYVTPGVDVDDAQISLVHAVGRCVHAVQCCCSMSPCMGVTLAEVQCGQACYTLQCSPHVSHEIGTATTYPVAHVLHTHVAGSDLLGCCRYKRTHSLSIAAPLHQMLLGSQSAQAMVWI